MVPAAPDTPLDTPWGKSHRTSAGNTNFMGSKHILNVFTAKMIMNQYKSSMSREFPLPFIC